MVDLEFEFQSIYECIKAEEKHGREKEIFWISGILLSIVGCLGLLGNTATIIVLGQPTMRQNVFNNLLFSLACFDIVFIISYGTVFSYKSVACYPLNPLIENVGFPFIKVGFLGSLYMTVAISLERYLGICHSTFIWRRKAWIYIVPVMLISVGFTVPIFIESSYFFINGSLSMTAKGIWSNHSTENDWDFWFAVFLNTIIPMTSILLLNGWIIKVIIKTPKPERMSTESLRKWRATRILLWIVLLFFITSTPRLVFRALIYHGPKDKGSWYWFRPLVRLALVCNSSGNFVIYCMTGSNFRNQFLKVFCPKSRRTDLMSAHLGLREQQENG